MIFLKKIFVIVIVEIFLRGNVFVYFENVYVIISICVYFFGFVFNGFSKLRWIFENILCIGKGLRGVGCLCLLFFVCWYEMYVWIYVLIFVCSEG